ncbi:MFS transporter [Streptomyces rectiverticillatus]|uniref:MFS transporter n=1 Tax=Streptomyces rectiverticillatus TaxID=173860 RepID=UPI0015C3A15E|nr:MFS transporter [Streptomyces rectiverticillatus]QLE70931.1 MFS transporter [Streptomyces rectiverticillatus]
MPAPPPSNAVFTTLTPRAYGMLAVLCGALFLDALDVSMKGVALPAIGTALGMSTSALQWVITGYVVGFGGFLLLGGRAADLLGRRRMLLISLAVFVVGSAVGGAASGGPLLIAARFVTGVGAAFSAPAGFSIITTSFAEGHIRNKALSIFTATGATGMALGMVIGGLLTDLNWRWVFFAPAAVGLLAFVGGLWVVPRSARPAGGAKDFDIAGAVTITATMLLVVFTLVQAPEAGWASLRTVGSLVVAALLLVLFVLIQRKVATPLVRLDILRSPALVRANLGAMSLIGAWIGVLFTMTLYLQDFRGWSAMETGFAVSPVGLVAAVLSTRIAAPLVGRFGMDRVILAGLVSAALAYLLLQFLSADTGYATLLLPSFLLIGLGFSLAYGPLTMAAADSVPVEDQGVAGGLVNTSFQVGPALGLSVVTAVNAANTGTAPDEVLHGLRVALVVPLIFAVLGVLAMLPALRRRRAVSPAPVPQEETVRG